MDNPILVAVRLTRLKALFCSKDGASQVKLKVGVRNDDQGHYFTFINSPDIALSERDKFKKELTSILAHNKGLSTPITPISGQSRAVAKPVPRPAPPSPSFRQPSRTNTPPNIASTSNPGLNQDDIQTCKRILLKDTELADLHRMLVMSGQVTEAEFWEGRQVCRFSTNYPLTSGSNCASICCKRSEGHLASGVPA